MFNRKAAGEDDEDFSIYINRNYPLPPLFPELKDLLTPATPVPRTSSVSVVAHRDPALSGASTAIALPTIRGAAGSTTKAVDAAIASTASPRAETLSSAPTTQNKIRIKIPRSSLFPAASQVDNQEEPEPESELEHKSKRHRYMLTEQGPFYDASTGVRADRLPLSVRRTVVSQGAILRREYRFNDTDEILTPGQKKELRLNANNQLVCSGREVTWWKKNKENRSIRAPQTLFSGASLAANPVSDPVPVLMRVVPEKPNI